MSFNYPRDVRYHCQRCAACCGDTGTRVRHILLLNLEAEQISKATSNPIKKFAFKVKGHEAYVFEMRKTAEGGKCIFLDGRCCTIYTLRPVICRFYPFELKTVKDGKHEFGFTEECKGIGKGKKLGKTYFENLFHQANDRLLENSKAVK